MDIRLRSLSYSSRLTLHKCPRKYQLSRLNSKVNELDDPIQSVTFSYGHCVGLGIQQHLEGISSDRILFNMFLMWEPSFLEEDTRRKKSFSLAWLAVQRFISLASSSESRFKNLELITYNSKPAVELSFIINLPNGYTYKGFVDAVLRDKETGEITVLEVKTSSGSNVSGATYKNSAQAIGYSIVLDVLFPELSSYSVLYLVYKTKEKEYEALTFMKSYLARALWIKELLLDIDILNMYESESIYPMHGESCFDFYRECEYFGLCTLSTDKLVNEISEDEIAEIERRNKNDFQINLSLNDLITSQLAKDI